MDEPAVLGRPGEGVARNTLFEMWTEANEGVESVLRAGGSVSSVAPKQLPLVQGSDQFLFIVPSFSVVKKFLRVAKFAAQSL